jgi:hypothetical protein
MSLTQKHIDDLKARFKKHLNMELSDEDAWEVGHNMVSLFKMLDKIADSIEEGEKKEKGKLEQICSQAQKK